MLSMNSAAYTALAQHADEQGCVVIAMSLSARSAAALNDPEVYDYFGSATFYVPETGDTRLVRFCVNVADPDDILVDTAPHKLRR
jgi:hypothetical protein